MAYTHQDSDKYMLRLPDGMREEIKAAATANRRSMNAEIIARMTANDPERQTLRDWFAGQALAAVIGNNELLNQISDLNPGGNMVALVSQHAYAFADAALVARAKGGDA